MLGFIVMELVMHVLKFEISEEEKEEEEEEI